MSVQQSLDRIAPHYDQHSALEQEVCRRLLERTFHQRRDPERILDLGCGTGLACAKLKSAFKKAAVIGLDLSTGMLSRLKKRSRLTRPLKAVCGDLQALPFRDQSLDFVFSVLALNWSSEPESIFAEIRRALKPEGLFLFATLGPGTMRELREACSEAGVEVHLPEFPDLLDLGNALFAAGFREPVMDREAITLEYPDLTALIKELEANGIALLIEGWEGQAGLEKRLQSAISWPSEQGKYPLNFEIVYGAAFGPDAQPGSTRDHRDTLTVSVDSLLKI